MVYATLISIPFEFDFTLDQWLNALQVMLEKSKGNPRPDKLRVIQLIEADLNMMLRIIFGRRLVHSAEDNYYRFSQLQATTQTPMIILQKDSKEVPHNLGARLAPGGNKNNEQAHLIHKGRTISQNISTSKLHKNEVMMAYRVMLRPAINYPLCGSTFSADEGNSINRSYLPTLLTRMDFNSKTKSVFWFF